MAFDNECNCSCHQTDYRCEQCCGSNKEFSINLDEARTLNKLLRLHHGLFRETEEYVQILRLINGLGTFVDKHGEKS